MRIITGTAKGTKLVTPKGLDVRPTSDRVKESLFNILGKLVVDANVLDLFAGTGNLGLEAVSRGARFATLVDYNLTSIGMIKQNSERTHLRDRIKVVHSDVLKFLNHPKTEGTFDLIFCDPPYNRGYVSSVLHKLDEADLLAPQGLIVFEHAKHEPMPEMWTSIELYRSQKYGETIISFLKHKY